MGGRERDKDGIGGGRDGPSPCGGSGRARRDGEVDFGRAGKGRVGYVGRARGVTWRRDAADFGGGRNPRSIIR